MSTIERLSSQDGWQEWKLIAHEGILPRLYTMFCPINDKELLIYGGIQDENDENPSFYIVNPFAQTVVTKQDDQYQQTVCYNSSARMVSEGRVIALVTQVLGEE